MSRTLIAVPAGLVGFFSYIALVLAAGDLLQQAHWAMQAIFYLVAGVAWAGPARWLMLWAAGQR